MSRTRDSSRCASATKCTMRTSHRPTLACKPPSRERVRDVVQVRLPVDGHLRPIIVANETQSIRRAHRVCRMVQLQVHASLSLSDKRRRSTMLFSRVLQSRSPTAFSLYLSGACCDRFCACHLYLLMKLAHQILYASRAAHTANSTVKPNGNIRDLS